MVKRLTPEQRKQLAIRNIRRRLIAYGTIAAVIYGFFLWIPWEYQWVEKEPPALELIDPDAAKLFAPGTKVLLVTAHPDDSEFYIGATLKKLGQTAHIHQVIVTDGDKSYYGPFTNVAENRKVRRAEATQALRQFGGETIEFLGFPDGRLQVNDQVIDAIAQVIDREKPNFILGFDPEWPPRTRHGDHRKTGVATYAAAEKAGFDGWMMMFQTTAPNYIVDVTKLWEEKTKLLAIHASQFKGANLGGVGGMVRRSAEGFGARIGAELGEGFRCVQF